MAAKELLIVGGPNGAGKTTIATEYASVRGLQFLSADAIAAQMSPDNPATARIGAGVEFIRQLNASFESDISLVVESTLSGLSLQRKIRKATEHGFTVTVAFVYLDDPLICLERVKERVQKGGHDVPQQDVYRRFGRSVCNFWEIYRKLADQWLLIYNSGDRPIDVAAGKTADVSMYDKRLLDRFLNLVQGDSHG